MIAHLAAMMIGRARLRVREIVSSLGPESVETDRVRDRHPVIAAPRARTAATTVRGRADRRAETSGRTANRVVRESFILRSDSYRES